MHINKKLYDLVINLLKTNIPSSYYYHNYEHTLYVIEKVTEIGIHENCRAKELELLNVAALWHDTGYIHTYKGHEEESCFLARQFLPGYDYSSAEIDRICGMILATKIPQTPQNKLEEIIADADLEYLGTSDAAMLAHNLFRELNAIDPSLTAAAWKRIEVDFLTSHKYFTDYCKANTEHLKHAYLQGLTGIKA